MIPSATDILKCERASLFMVDEPHQQLWARIPGNGKRDADGKVQMRRIVVPMNDKSIVGFVQQTCRILNIRGAYKVSVAESIYSPTALSLSLVHTHVNSLAGSYFSAPTLQLQDRLADGV